jgi:hypothetical protein
MTEAEELLSDLRAVYGERHPDRDPDAMRISDDVLALGILLRREILLARTRFCPPAYAEGATTGATAKPRGKR